MIHLLQTKLHDHSVQLLLCFLLRKSGFPCLFHFRFTTMIYIIIGPAIRSTCKQYDMTTSFITRPVFSDNVIFHENRIVVIEPSGCQMPRLSDDRAAC